MGYMYNQDYTSSHTERGHIHNAECAIEFWPSIPMGQVELCSSRLYKLLFSRFDMYVGPAKYTMVRMWNKPSITII